MSSSELIITYPEESKIIEELQSYMAKKRMDVLSIKITSSQEGLITALLNVRVSKTEALNEFLSIASLSHDVKEFSISN
jgi:(p)ppGpp synthase/HD superfamily hydrolase